MPRTPIQHSFRFTNSQVSVCLNACVHGALSLSFQRSQEKGKAGFQALEENLGAGRKERL